MISKAGLNKSVVSTHPRKAWLRALPYAVSFMLHAAFVFAMLYHAPSGTVSPQGITLELLSLAEARPTAVSNVPHEKSRPRGDIAVRNKSREVIEESKQAAKPSDAAENVASSNSSAKFGQTVVPPSALSQYVTLLVEALQKNRSYPRDAINREEEGVVALAVKLGSAGDVIEARVQNPSPFESLNAAALKTVRKIGQFPKPPIADGASIELTIPMRFKIERL